MTEFELLYRSTLDFSMATEEKDRFKNKLKDIALSSFKFFSDNCKFENNLSAEEINSLKALMRIKNIIIQKADKSNTCNWIRTHNHLVHKRTLNHLAKLASLAKWLSVRL